MVNQQQKFKLRRITFT